MSETCIIVGGSHAGGQLAISLRQEGWTGPIRVISDEPSLPYHRPPLSKGFLAERQPLEDILIRKASLYEQKQIDFQLETRVDAIDRAARQLHLSDGSRLHYHKLALALGGRNRHLDLPGQHLAGIHYLRSARDALDIRDDLAGKRRVVIVGGGYIGLELAASLRQQGLEVTLLETLPRVLARVTAPQLSAFYQRVHAEAGVAIHTGMAVTGFSGELRVTGVRCADGQEFPADAVMVGIGIIPNTELAADAGLAVDNGIVVDELARTSDPDIVAAGDCTSHPNPLLGRRLRLESVPNANDQAKTAAATLCGKHKPHASLPWFWSDQYDLKLQMAGLNTDHDEVILRGDPATRSFAAWYLRGGAVIAVDCVNRPAEFMAAKLALGRGLKLDVARLADESIAPKALILQD